MAQLESFLASEAVIGKAMTQLKKSLNPRSYVAGNSSITKLIQEKAAKDIRDDGILPLDGSQLKSSEQSVSSG